MRAIGRPISLLLPSVSWFALSLLLALGGQTAQGAEPTVTVSVGRSGEAFVVDATMELPVAVGTAWEVMTDFDHMTSYFENLTLSKVSSRAGNTWIVRQEGIARYGLLSFPFESEREMRLEPMQRIFARHLSGTAKRMESETRLAALDHGVRITYHAESVVNSMLGRMFGLNFLRHEVEEQWRLMAREMLRRNGIARSASVSPG
jgi:hypothetical protein